MLLFGKPVSVLIDTGAETSFIDMNTTLHADADVDRPTVGLSAVGQTGVSVVGEITAKFSYSSLPKKVFPHRLTVTEDSRYKVVLGQDFLKLLDPVVQYHYREDRLDVADLPFFEVWYEDGRKPMRFSAFTCTKVPKRARALMRVQVEGTEGEETVILRRNYPRGFPGLAIPDQVVDIKAGVATKLPPVDLSHLSRELRERYEGVLQEYSNLWSRSRFDIGELRVDGKPFEVTIPPGDSPPIRWNQDRILYHQREHVKKELEKMEEGGVIHPSTSPWAAPVVLIKKPDGMTRFCLDFRKLNQATKRDLFPLPRIQETLDRLAGAKVFSALDYTSGFQQLHMHPDHAEKTAFVTPFGLYEFTKMPFSRSHDEHIQDLREVLGLVRKANLKLKLEKAQIAITEVEYLGHTVSEKGVRPSRKNIRKILQWKPPQDRKELRSFLYLCSYYRHFIAGFARLSFPFFQMLLPQAADEQGRPVPFVWNGEREEIFGELKERLTTPPILGFPDMSLPFRMKPNAYEVSVGDVFTQMQRGREVVIVYVSRGLSTAEKNYSPTEREALGAVYCCKQWRHYVFRGVAYVITDHKPNLAMSDRKVANKRVHNWALELQEYRLTFIHKKERNMWMQTPFHDSHSLPRLFPSS
uniref:RNA-directed DNA polymerase n=1 Tax=Chromera velia CCMP2878 TaxID=1169474 RepID=A0A0G4I720_9ALVE|eukprot:Cvel_11569.t1-p1 / transcript=Cvel_11569.t1 / gene=Cvel_11569 / organism=Chromera_velia_CCMP2878 / gene_product=Retrovirus-related Pol polyprotein from transposon, putative / transcript_product=Retrovirus-related Pol polyprotein from transposon, putative / location=Cvel_scaffold731:36172-38379(+) / protein_length=638 / sequence_SO=supercontig / SO=protein_coding / is_pseudo=false